MRLPSRWVRRVVLAPALVLFTVFVLTTLPVWLLVAGALSPFLPGRLRALRVLWVAVVALTLESAVLVVLGGLWLAAGFGAAIRTPPFQYLHYQLVGWYLRVLYRETARVLRLRVAVEGPNPDAYLDRPLLVFCRHAGPGDSFLLVHALINWYAREPRIVLAEALQWDPALDVVLNRLPNRFLPDGGGEQVQQRIGALATALDHNDAFVILPEGGNFTERRRLAAIARLRARGLEEMARRSEAMRHVLPPRPGGVAAALAAAADADVVWVAHAGLDHLYTVADIWRELPLDGTVRMRWWRVPAAEVPRNEDAQVDWLYRWWARIDDWIDDVRQKP
ncbi:MAG: 1-acyl-sn-glycerol-3-phosphate acyltransferase [Pseudonocardiaceae bacterium]